MIEAGAAGVHFEDQLASEKKCGHLGGKVLVPTSAVHPHADRGAPRGRRARRADRARRAHRRAQRDAAHERHRPERRRSSSPASARPRASSASATGSRPRSPAALAYAPYADLLWFETSTPDLGEAREFAAAIHDAVPGQAARLQLLAVVQLEQPPRRRRDRELPARPRASSATASSSSRSPASTRSTRRCSSSRAATAERHDRLRPRCRSASSRSRPTATPPRATSARSAPATST